MAFDFKSNIWAGTVLRSLIFLVISTVEVEMLMPKKFHFDYDVHIVWSCLVFDLIREAKECEVVECL